SGGAWRPGSGLSAAEGQAEADRAILWLRKAVAAGYLKVAWMRTELGPLRARPDFQALMMDVEFPSDPFSKETSTDLRRIPFLERQGIVTRHRDTVLQFR